MEFVTPAGEAGGFNPRSLRHDDIPSRLPPRQNSLFFKNPAENRS